MPCFDLQKRGSLFHKLYKRTCTMKVLKVIKQQSLFRICFLTEEQQYREVKIFSQRMQEVVALERKLWSFEQ